MLNFEQTSLELQIEVSNYLNHNLVIINKKRIEYYNEIKEILCLVMVVV